MLNSPLFLGKTVVKILEKHGYELQSNHGSHMYFSDGTHKVSVPRHDEIKLGTLISIMTQMGLERDEFLRILYDL